MRRRHRIPTARFFPSGCRCSASVTGCSSWRISSGERWSMAGSANTATGSSGSRTSARFSTVSARRWTCGIRTATSSRNSRRASVRSAARTTPNTPSSRNRSGVFTDCNFIPRSSTRRAARSCWKISCTRSAALRRTGRWDRSSRRRARESARRSAAIM